MTSVNGIVAASSGGTSQTTPSSTAITDQVDQNMFLKLLVAQLQYQDPSNPTDPTQFVSQTAQFSMVDKLTALSSTQAQLMQLDTQLVQQVQSQTAASLIGKTVTWTDATTGLDKTGVVTAATLGAAPAVSVGGSSVLVSSLTGVVPAAGSSGSTAA
jgi:flagellar basal-body rod modification protein FlgD